MIVTLHRRNTALEVIASAIDHTLFAFAHGLQIHRNGARLYTVKSATPCQIGDARAGDHRFGGSTADVDTDTTELAARRSAPLSGPPSRRLLGGICRPDWCRSQSHHNLWLLTSRCSPSGVLRGQLLKQRLRFLQIACRIQPVNRSSSSGAFWSHHRRVNRQRRYDGLSTP